MEGIPLPGSPCRLSVNPPRADAASSVLVPPLSMENLGGAQKSDGSSPRVALGSDGRARFTVQARDKYGHNDTKVLRSHLPRLDSF